MDHRAIVFEPGTPVVALPSWRRPRLLVASHSRSGRWRGSAFYPAFRWSARRFRSILRLTALGRASRRSPEPGAPLDLREFWSDLLPGVLPTAVRLGQSSGPEKWVVQLSDPSGDVVAYLKCGWNESARLRMRREYEVLRRLPSGLGPTALRYACADGCDLLLTTAIAGSTLTPALPPPAELRGFLRGLDQGRAAGLGQHPALGTLPTSWPAVDRCLEALSSREWSVVIQHGDLTPWNLIRNPEGRLSAIDWEYGHLDGMPGLDLAHHILQIGLFIYRWPPRRTIEYAVRFLLRDDSGSLGPGEAAALVRLGAAQAYAHAEHDGAPGHHPLQRWRRAVWEAA